ncbi:MAG: MFS transporter, partial [Armatimonadetes bacterium]|nr:MFS transporter [Armatimonadota bacterium]
GPVRRLPFPSQVRWWIAAALVLGSILNYIDRSALGVAANTIRDELQINAAQYGFVTTAFLLAYTVSYLLGGLLVDRIGTRGGYLVSLCGWSVANMAHALSTSLGSLMFFRALLGLFEAIFFPAAMRAFTEWFHPRDRSKPVGWMLAGATIGAAITPTLVGWLMMPVAEGGMGIGWKGAFVVTGAMGFLLVPLWLWIGYPPARNRFVGEAERRYLAFGTPAAPASAGGEPTSEPKVPIRTILRQRETWILIPARAVTDASWYLLLFWLVLYLERERGFTLRQIAELGWIPFVAADLGAITGGWLSSRLIAAGLPVVTARRRCMALFAALLPATLVAYFLPRETPPLLTVLLFSLGTFGHMGWGCNSLTLHTDLFPPQRVATIMGITGAAGSLAGALAGLILGWLVTRAGDLHYPIFYTTALLHPGAAVVIFFGLRASKPFHRDAAVGGSPGGIHANPVH